MNNLSPGTFMEIETLKDQLESIFHELDLALHWKRPSILFAIYNSADLRREAQDSLEKQILLTGQEVIHYQFEYEGSVNLVQFVSDIKGTQNSVFYIDPLNSEGKSSQIQSLISMLNSCRDYLVDHLVRVVFWLTENEALTVAHLAPDFWASRHRVFEFIAIPGLEQKKSISNLLNVSSDEKKASVAKSFSFPTAEGTFGESALVVDLNEGDDAGKEINILLMKGVEYWKEGHLDTACTPLREALEIAEKCGDKAHQVMCHKAIALVKSDSGNEEEAIHAYYRVIELGLETVTIWNNIGSLYQIISKYDDALLAFNNALRLEPHDPVSWNGLGGVYAGTGRLEEAIDSYRKAIQFNSSYMTPWVKLGDVLLRQNRIEDALYAYMRTVEMDNKNVHAWSEIGSIFFKAGSYEQAVDAYKKALRLGVDSADLYANLADSYANIGDYTEAILYYQKAIERETDNSAKSLIWNRLGDARRRVSDYESAVGAYEMADKLVTALGESNAKAESGEMVHQSEANQQPQESLQPAVAERVNLALELERGSNVVTSSLSLDSNLQVSQSGITTEGSSEKVIVQSDPKGAHIWTRLGNTYLKAGAIDRAIDVFNKAVNLDPTNFQEYGNLAQAYIQKKDLLGAISSYRKSIELLENKKDKAIVLSKIGDLYRQLREFVRALDAFESAIEFDPGNEEFLTGLSKIQEDLDSVGISDVQLLQGQTKNALTDLSEATLFSNGENLEAKNVSPFAQSPDLGNINLNNANVWNELGNIFTRAKVYAEAADAYNKAIELNPHFGWSYSNLALVYARQGKREAAVNLYRKSIELLWTDLDKAIAWNRLGDVFRQSGNYADAIDAYQNADSLGQGSYEIGTFHEIKTEQLFTHFVS